jgi:hypothetical protein
LTISDPDASLPGYLWNSYNSDVCPNPPTEAGMSNAIVYYKAIGMTPAYVRDFMFDAGWSSGTNSSGVLIATNTRFTAGSTAFIANYVHTNVTGGRFWLLAMVGKYIHGSMDTAGIQGYETANATAFIKDYHIDGLSLDADGSGEAAAPATQQGQGQVEMASFLDAAIAANRPLVIMWNVARTPSAQRFIVQAVSGDICPDGPGITRDATTEWKSLTNIWDGYITKQLPYVNTHWHPCYTTTGLFQGNTNMVRGFLCQMGLAPFRCYLSTTSYVASVAYLLTNNAFYYDVLREREVMPGKVVASCKTNEIGYRPLPTIGGYWVSFWNKDTKSISPTMTFSLTNNGLNGTWYAYDPFANTNCIVTGSMSVGGITNASSVGFILTRGATTNVVSSGLTWHYKYGVFTGAD